MSKFLDYTGLGVVIDWIKAQLKSKQAKLVSGTTIKTVNNNSLLGSGNINITSSITGDGVSGSAINRFATCSTAASTVAKTASITSGSIPTLSNGLRVTVYFSNKNTANSPTLNINSKGAHSIYYNGTQITSGTEKGLLYGAVDFVYYSSRWNLVGVKETSVTAQPLLTSGTNIKTINSTNILTSGNLTLTTEVDKVSGSTINRFATCSTAAATVAKTASIANGTPSLANGTRVTVYFTNKNTANSPTLNINSTGAKSIYINGTQITSGVNKGLLYGAVDFVYYSSRWNLVGCVETGVTAQEILTSGTNIKTINNQSILGSGNITIEGGGGGGGITGTGVTAIVALTESEYAALTTKDATTLYIVKPDTGGVTS